MSFQAGDSIDFGKTSKLLNVILHTGNTAAIDAALTTLGQLGFDTDMSRLKTSNGENLLLSLEGGGDLLLDVSPYMVIYSDETIPTESFTYPFTNSSSFFVNALTHGLLKVTGVTIYDSDGFKMLGTVQVSNDLTVTVSFSKQYSGKILIF